DYKKVPKKFWNQKGLKMIWSEDEKLYIGTDAKGKEWIASIQHTRVPIFSVTCTNTQRKGNAEIVCGAINFAAIFEKDDNIQCRKCKKVFTVTPVIPKSSNAYKILENLDK
ncbi:MAG: hypothetical protein O6761_07755, partial [Thaumarchaeota archaeon]|nr:hypothetical protein [Nitrososphaerota archaeon]